MENEETLNLLRQIRDLQQQQVTSQNAMLKAQGEYMTLYKAHIKKAEEINNRTERIQGKSEAIMGMAKKSGIVIFIIIILLLSYLSWILFAL